jgi:hypothetical protein
MLVLNGCSTIQNEIQNQYVGNQVEMPMMVTLHINF